MTGGPFPNWCSFAPFIIFDGRPYETYDSVIIQQVTFISDTYFNYYIKQDNGNNPKLQALVKKIHDMGKLVRVWGISDKASSWQM